MFLHLGLLKLDRQTDGQNIYSIDAYIWEECTKFCRSLFILQHSITMWITIKMNLYDSNKTKIIIDILFSEAVGRASAQQPITQHHILTTTTTRVVVVVGDQPPTHNRRTTQYKMVVGWPTKEIRDIFPSTVESVRLAARGDIPIIWNNNYLDHFFNWRKTRT